MEPRGERVTAHRSYGEGVFWVMVGSVAMGAVQWACIVALGRSASPTEVGHLSLAYAIAAPFFMATNGQLRQLLAADVGSGASFGDYFTLRLAGATLALIMAALAGLVTDLTWAAALTVLLVAVAKWGEALGDICYGVFQASDHAAEMGRSMLVRACLGALTGVGIALQTRAAAGAAAGVALASVSAFLLLERPRSARALQSMSSVPARRSLVAPAGAGQRDRVVRLLTAALPLGMAAGLGAMTWNLPRYFLQWYRGAHDQGVFSALAVLPLAVSTLPAALAQVITPRLAEWKTAGRHGSFRRLVVAAAVGGASLGLAGAVSAFVAGSAILTGTLGPSYASSSTLLGYLFVASVPQYVLFTVNAAFVASGRYGAQLAALAPAAAAGSLAGVVLVPRHGVGGAIAAYGIAGLTQCLVSGWRAVAVTSVRPK